MGTKGCSGKTIDLYMTHKITIIISVMMTHHVSFEYRRA